MHGMIRTGDEYRETIRDGRDVWIDGERVTDVTIHPAFKPIVDIRARIYDLNTIGLRRRGLSPEVITKLKRSFRYLLQSKLNTTNALRKIQQDRSLACPEVQYLVDFIVSSQRGVILRRATRRAEEILGDE